MRCLKGTEKRPGSVLPERRMLVMDCQGRGIATLTRLIFISMMFL